MKRVLALKSRKRFDTSLLKKTMCTSSTSTSNLKMKKSKSQEGLYVPDVPFFCPITKHVRDNETVRSVLVYDRDKAVAPRMSWYTPDEGIVPNNWFLEGIYGDLSYYFDDDNK